MKRCTLLLLLFSLMGAAPAAADWRWASPHFKAHKVTYSCDSLKCVRQHYLKERHRYKRKTAIYNKRRLREWRHWTKLFIPACTWYGESGYGPKYARIRYTMPNSTGSGAYGKFQMMPSTYHSDAKYHDWSALDQEIAGRREYWKHGTFPWQNC